MSPAKVGRARRAPLAVLAVVLLAAVGALYTPAGAYAQPDITLDKQAPDTVLFGSASPVTLRVANPQGQPTGYNLSIRDVLPPGISYVPGSADVQPLILQDAPSAGETTLIFENLSDLSPNSSFSLHYEVAHDSGVLGIGDTYVNEAGAYVNQDPRFIPDFDANGQPSGDATGSATDSASTEITGIEIVKSEPSPEGELLRGVHDHQTVYTLTVRNNAVEPTDAITVEDWLPAGLEFLGCGADDHTTDAPTNPAADPQEYPGSGPLNPGNAPPAPDCREPDLVETVMADPDGAGPMPMAVYTHVVWNDVGELLTGEEIHIQYVAAVPLRENTLDWGALTPVPTPESLQQGSNLDNNSGPETYDEQPLVNYATVAGLYDGALPVSDSDTLTRSAEDLAIEKTVSTDAIEQGEISTWSLHIRTSEYRYVEDVSVVDTLPDGLCPLGTENYEDDSEQEAECDPTGDLPSHDYTDVTENADGTYSIVWDSSTQPGLLGLREPSTELTITFPTRTRSHYQENFQDDTPVLAEDSWENHVEVEGLGSRICAPDDATCTLGADKIDGDAPEQREISDVSAARQQAGPLSIDKRVREAGPAPVDCATGNYVDGPPPAYGPGDEICWQLRVDFPTALDSGDPVVTDFLPPGTSYVPDSAVATGANDVSSTFDDSEAGDGRLTWQLGVDSDGYVEGGRVFEWRFATSLDQSPGSAAGDILGNLMKLSYENSDGVSFPLRDEVDFARSQARLDLLKGVRDVGGEPAGGNGPNTDGAFVAAGDEVTFRIDVSNDGDLDATGAEVWDELQDGITCDDVSAVSDGGTCDGTTITWTGLAVPASSDVTLTYTVTMPANISPGQRFDDYAGVVTYASATNTGGTFDYYPADNVDPDAPAANAPAADDDSYVETRAISFQKDRETTVQEDGNNLPSQATIGERIDYTVTAVVPEGTTLYGSPLLEDVLGARQTLVTPPDVTATLNGVDVDPGDFTLDTSGNTVSLQFPATYENAPGTGDDTFEVTFSAVVADVAANRRIAPDHTLTNTARLSWQDQDGNDHNPQTSINTTIVEPNVAVAKTNDDADGIVLPGQTLTYTVTASNVSGTRVSTAHDLELVDDVPEGLTPTEPIDDGGVWDDGTRTITWTIASLAPGGTAVRTYEATVDEPAVAGSVFHNTVDLTATSLAGPEPGERDSDSPVTAGYVASADDTVRLEGATLTKTVDPETATIGDQVTYTATATFPGNITYNDATVIDELPDGLVFDGTVDVSCDDDPCSPAVTPLDAEAQPDGSTRIAWFLDDLAAQPDERTYTIVYTAHVADERSGDATPVLDGQTLTNRAAAFYDSDDDIAGVPTSIPDPGDFSDNSGFDDAVLDVVEPAVTIDKGVSGDPDGNDVRDTQPGDSYTYSLVVHNSGSSPAYDISVTDTPDAALLQNIAVVPNPDAVIVDGDGSDGTLAWTIPGPLAPDASVTLTYTADLAPSADLSDGDTVVNTADVASFWGVSGDDRDTNPDWDYREYTDVPDDTVTLNVHVPQLTVDKTTGAAGFPDSAVAEVGEPFAWRVTVANASDHAVAESVDVRDVLPANWSYVAGSASFAPGGPAEPTIASDPGGDVLTWQDVGDLGPGEELVLTFEARPAVGAVTDPGTGAGSPNVNAADASAVDASGASASSDGPYADDDDANAVLEVPELSVDKTPDGDTVNAGEQASYSIVVANDGTVPAREVVVTDVLGAGQSYTPGDAEAVPAGGFSETSVTAGPGAGETTIVWAIDEIPADGSVTITVPVATDSSLPDATDLVNDAAAVSREITDPVTDDGSLVTELEADVGILKEPQAGPVVAGNEMDFTITVFNDGPSDATGVTVEDVLPANLEFVSADSPCTEDGGTVTCPIGDLAADDSVALTLRVRVDPDETVEVVNTATVESTTPDPNPDNDESEATKPVGVEANIVVDKEGPDAPVLQGTSFDYVVTVTNDGVSAATDVTLSDALPAGLAFEDVETDTGNCSESGATVDCDLGTMQPGGIAVITITVRAVDVGTTTNTAVAQTPSDETTTDDNADDAEVTVVPASDLGVTKTAPASVPAGGQIPYVLEVTNKGPSAATGVTLTDTLPAGVQFVSADEPECAFAAGVVTCAVGDLAVLESRTYSIVVSVPYALAGQALTNSVVVGGNEGDLVPENDGDQATTTVGPAADLSIAKTSGGARAGGLASWTLVVRNHGPSTADPVTVTDTLPAGTTLRSATPGQGSCGASGAVVTCQLGSLASGGATQIAIVADVAADMAGQRLVNRATVSAPQPDPDPSNDTDEASTEVGEPEASGPNVTLSKTAGSQRPQLGGRLRYRLVVRNIGDVEARGVRVFDTPSKAVKIEGVTTSKGRCVQQGSEVRCNMGTLAAGERETIVLTVVPTAPGPLRNVASANVRGGPGIAPDIDPSDNSDRADVRVSAPAAGWALTKRASRRAVRGGEAIRFAIRVRVGRRAVANARVCDRLPAGLVFVRAPGARFSNGRACWNMRYLPRGARRTLRIVARAERGFTVRRIRNVAVANARNAARRAAAARVRIDPAFGGAGGGVTG